MKSTHCMAPRYLPEAPDRSGRAVCVPLRGTSGRSRAPQRGALRGPVRRAERQFFLAGTAVGSVRLAVRARVTRVEVPLAGAFFAAAGVALRAGAVVTGVAVRAAALVEESAGFSATR